MDCRNGKGRYTVTDVAAILDASQMASVEEAFLEDAIQTLQELPGLTLADIQVTFRRIGYHRRQQDRVRTEVEEAVAVLQTQISQLKAYEAEQMAIRERSIAFHQQRLVAFYRLNPPAKGKTLKLPGGMVAKKDPPIQWSWTDEEALLAYVRANHIPAVRVPPTPPFPEASVDKAALKRWATVDTNAKIAINPETGETLPGVMVVQPEAEFVVQLAE